MSRKNFSQAFKPKLVYVYRINDKPHAGCLKVGETSLEVPDGDLFELHPNSKKLNDAARACIATQTQRAGIEGVELLYTELLLSFRKGNLEGLNDHDVHDVLLHSNIKKKVFNVEKKANEWFITDLNTVMNAIKAAKEGRKSLLPHEITSDRSPIVFRPEQRDAIDRTKKRFKSYGKMLWYAKMRFGKTLSALQVAKETPDFKRTIILTHRPVVNQGWYDDFDKIFYDRSDYAYGSMTKNGDSFWNLCDAYDKKGQNFVFFASLQFLRRKEDTSTREIREAIIAYDWDYVIVDEAHEGTQTELGKEVVEKIIKKHSKLLSLSGTPFNIMDDYDEASTYTWDYVMEQKAKEDWDVLHCGDPNPYAVMPRLNIYTYELAKEFKQYSDVGGAFNFKEFFRVDNGGGFIHGDDVKAFLDLMTKPDPQSCYPYSNEVYCRNFRHTLWMVPGVKEASALSSLLKQHPVFGGFDIVNVAGAGDEEEPFDDALKKVTDAIGDDPDETYTITLSCSRLTTGVTVKPWTAVFMLAGSYNTDAKRYMQTIFRVQSPANINGRQKEECFAFDFAPDRTLRVIAETAKFSVKGGQSNSESDRTKMGEFLNFCPVISVEGSRMKEYDVPNLLEQLKRVYIERVVEHGFEDVYLYRNDELMKLTDVEVQEFEKLKKEIGKTGKAAPTGDIDVNKQGYTEEEYEKLKEIEKKKRERKPLSEEEERLLEERKEKNKMRLTAISILRGISIRMPLLLYGAEVKNEEHEITLDNFTNLVDDASWQEFIPQPQIVTKDYFNTTLKKYYDPEVFAASGRKIRDLAKAADGKPIEERIERITSIMGTFRNPDKETVLTPWRVVNRHLSSTVGGWCFYDDKYEFHSSEPRFVNKDEVTARVFNPDTKILELNSKSGLYPLYMVYSILRSRCPNYENMTDVEREEMWDRVVRENVFVVCMTPMAKQITKRTLVGFRPARVNTRFFDDLLNQMKNKQDNLLWKIQNANEYNKKNPVTKMKFNAAVGNPPYQLTVIKTETKNGQKPVVNIFQHFQLTAEKVADITSLIYPAGRWIHQSGKGLTQFGLEQINDVHLRQLEFFPNASEVFNYISIPDGISIVLKDSTKQSSGFSYIFTENGVSKEYLLPNPGNKLMALDPRDKEIAGSIDEVISSKGFSYLSDSILPRSLFSIESDFVENHPELVREYNPGDAFNKNTEIKLFTNDKAGAAGRSKWFIVNRSEIKTGLEYLNDWKVVVSSAHPGGQDKRDNQIAVLDNYSAFGRARVALKTFKTEREARNFMAYAQSDLIRFAFLLTDEALTSLAKQVPDINDYSDDNGYLDFSKDINSQIYELFGIDEPSQEYIRKTLAAKSKSKATNQD